MLTPAQIADTLQVSPATVRRWSARFARHLTPHTPNKKRAYSTDDLAILVKVRDLSALGTPLDQIDQSLSVPDPAGSSALITIADFARALQYAQDLTAHLQSQLDEQTARLDALTAWLALPLYKRIGKRPPK
jgi:DNA-binding transcriptional MerR regulator